MGACAECAGIVECGERDVGRAGEGGAGRDDGVGVSARASRSRSGARN